MGAIGLLVEYVSMLVLQCGDRNFNVVLSQDDRRMLLIFEDPRVTHSPYGIRCTKNSSVCEALVSCQSDSSGVVDQSIVPEFLDLCEEPLLEAHLSGNGIVKVPIKKLRRPEVFTECPQQLVREVGLIFRNRSVMLEFLERNEDVFRFSGQHVVDFGHICRRLL